VSAAESFFIPPPDFGRRPFAGQFMAKAGLLTRTKHFLSSLDQPYKFTAHLAIFGLVGTIIGSYFQYASWREEKILTRHENEMKSAIKADTEIISALSSVMNLQSMLLFGFKNAEGYEGGVVSQQLHTYLSKSANDIHKSYFEARTNLRLNIDAMADKAALFIDRPNETDSRRADDQERQRPMPLISNRDELRAENFSCEQHLPRSDKTTLKNQVIDWSNVHDEVRTFYYCLEDIHSELLFVRVWAESSGAAPDYDRPDVQKRLASLETKVSLQGIRMSALMSASNHKIEALRLKELPQGFFRYQLGLAQ
jgi:hypothetical protein